MINLRGRVTSPINVSQTKAVLLSLAFILAVIVAPRVLIGTVIPYRAQDFPLIDDFIYTRGACALFHNHELDYQHWASPALLGQWLWSMPFLAVLEDSRLATRTSTIVLSCLGLWAFYALLRRQPGVPPSVAAFATACLAWSPLFFFLSWSYMSDVPAVSFSLIALALYAHALDSGRLVPLAVAVVAALAAIATRQNAIAVPLTAGVLLLRSGYRTKPLWLAAVAVPLAFFVVLDAWHSKRPDVVVLHARLPNFDDLCWLAFTSLHYLGLLATPLLLLLPPARRGKVFWATLAIMIAGALWLFFLGQNWRYEGVFPYVDDLFTARRGHLMRAGESWGSLFSWSLRLLATALGCVCAAIILARVAESGWRLLTCPLVIFALLNLAILAFAPTYFDRYLLPLVPGVLALAVWECRGPRWKASLAALIVLGGVSIGLTHDWLSWNAACWQLGRRAAAHGIDPGDIQGGFEWDFSHGGTVPVIIGSGSCFRRRPSRPRSIPSRSLSGFRRGRERRILFGYSTMDAMPLLNPKRRGREKRDSLPKLSDLLCPIENHLSGLPRHHPSKPLRDSGRGARSPHTLAGSTTTTPGPKLANLAKWAMLNVSKCVTL